MKWRGPFGQGSASGKLGALVASRNRGGQYLRARTTPINPSTIYQQDVRNSLRTLVAIWQNDITQVQRDAWDTYADNVTVTDTLGDQRNRTGQNWFVGVNTPRLQAGLDRIDDAPTVYNQGDTGIAVFDLSSTTAGSLSLGTPPIGWTDTTQTQTLLLYISAPFSDSRGFLKVPTRLAGTLSNQGVTAPVGGTFTLPTPAAGSNNQVAWFYRIAREDGRLSGPFRNSTQGF
jgi:hypothetical protein